MSARPSTKPSLAAFLVLALALAGGGAAAAAQARTETQDEELPQDPRDIVTPELESWVPPEPDRRRLECGVELLVIEDHELPLVDGSVSFHAGSIHEDPSRVGLVDVLTDALREGGSTQTSGPELDAWLDEHAASIRVSGDRDRITISFSCLAEDLDAVLGHVTDLVRSPAYPEAEVEKSKARLATAVARRVDDTAQLADATLLRVIFGHESPWARQATKETARAITREDVLAFHRAHLGPDRMLIGAVGDVDPDTLAARLEKLLDGLDPVGPAPRVLRPMFFTPPSTRIYLVDRPGVAQTELRIGALGASRASPEYPGLYLWSNVIGIGGMTNRLMLRVRTELGLAYTVGAFFLPAWTHPGYFYGWCGTRNEQAGAALGEILQTLAEARNNLIPKPEFETARERLLNAEVFRVDTPSKVLDRAIDLAFYGYVPDYWQEVEEKLRTVPVTEACSAVLRRLTASRMVAVAVGPADQIEKQLRGVAEVRRISVEPGAAESSAAGREATERVLAATGGRERWAALHGVEFESTFQAPGLTITTHQWYALDEPWIRMDQRVRGRKNLVVLTPEEAWQNDAVDIDRLSNHDHSRLVLSHERWLPRLLHELAVPDSELAVDVDDAGKLQISDDRGPLCWIELGEDGRPTRVGWDGVDAETLELKEWGDADGYAYVSVFERSALKSDVEITRFVPNVELAPKLFDLAAELDR